jgi:hemolysin activation/secretion protein
VSFGVDDKVFKATTIDGVVAGVDRRSRPFTLGYSARTESDTSVWGYNADIAANLPGGPNNDLESYRTESAEPARFTTARWKAVHGGINYGAPLMQTWLWSARAQFQYSPDVLISGEQFGLGGVGSVRGTSTDRPISGDKGASGTVEINTPELQPGLRFLGFVDAGWLGNNRPDGAAKPSTDHLASVGLGLRYAREPFAISADYGRLVVGSKVPLTLNSTAPQKGDDRFYVNLSVHF